MNDELKAKKKELRESLAARQVLIKEKKMPVVVLVEGWGASGKGNAIGKMINNLDPRFFNVANMEHVTDDEARRPFLYRYAIKLPQYGRIQIYEGGWMDEVTKKYLHKEYTEEEYAERIHDIRVFERQMRDNGYLVVKVFLDVSEKEQTRRFKELLAHKDTAWRINERDLWENKHYKKSRKVYMDYITQTDSLVYPWHIIDTNKKSHVEVELQMSEILVHAIDDALENKWIPEIPENPYQLVKQPKLSEVTLEDKVLTDEEYKIRLKAAQKRMRELQNIIYRKKIPVVIAYEGWDAAGKGGNIKRVAAALDPRDYEVFPVASPSVEEKERHFLWRFWNKIPKDGHIAIFDRTWYGRVMVERLEGFCSENDWQRAFNEINEFEEELAQWGCVVIKFWVHIDKNVQLERFTDRQNTPSKQWKITDEDWRNREKWDLYEGAIDEMIEKTSTVYAPWTILESNDKKYARVKALETIIAEVEKHL